MVETDLVLGKMNDPRTIGKRYIIDTLISPGMMGPLYRGRDRSNGQTVAIKVLRPENLENHPTLLERFLREGEALRQLNHPNIVQWLDVIEEEGVHFLIMDFVAGGSLYQALRQEPQLPIERILEIGLDLADALTRAHRLGIIHRDIKPQNILLSEDGRPLLSDFGIAHYVERTTISEPGDFAGTLAYIPPEAFLDLEIDERADIWSMGVLLYEMLAGVKPFESDNTGALIHQVINQQPASLSFYREDIPNGLVRLVERMLEKDRADRLPSIRMVGVALEAIRAGQEVDLPATPRPPSLEGLPIRPTPFIGRQSEIDQVIELLMAPACRLVTLVGPGGVGKSRLGLEVAQEVAGNYPDGIFFVDLSPILTPGLVAGRIARSLGLKEGPARSPLDSIIDHLRHRRCLLLLDNFEQVMSAATDVGKLIDSIAGLDVLATSREPLHLYGEQEYLVSPFDVPDSGEALTALGYYESVALFVRHAQLFNPNFRLTDDNARAVAEICSYVDGLPLAIELAAARTKHYPPDYLLPMIVDSLDVLGGGPQDIDSRHQTLRETIDWSYRLLNDVEKRLFDRLSVFQGGRSLEAIKAICQPDFDQDVFPVVESLVNKSLLRRSDDQLKRPRFLFLEIIQQFAREQLQEAGESEIIFRRHAHYFADTAEAAEPQLRGPQQERWSTLLRLEYDNVRAALKWAFEGGDDEIGSRLAGALAEFWYYEGPISEGERWITLALDRMDSETVSAPFKAKVLNGAGMLAFATGNHAGGRQWNEQALAIAMDHDDLVGAAWALFWLSAHDTIHPSTYHEGIKSTERALELFRQVGDETGLAWGYNQLGEFYRLVGELAKARQAYDASLAICRETGNKRREAIALVNLTYVAHGLGEYAQAEQYCLAGLTLLQELKLEYHSAIALSMLVGPLVAMGHGDRAATILGAADAIFKRMAAALQPADRVEIEKYEKQARQLLGDDRFDLTWQQGQKMSLEEVLSFAFAKGQKGTSV